ncbi:MAG TPA: hypothetical protein VHU18_04195 [Rhizomicrobium sp.]|jgi:hypothetical protein|nr:hypothetical protein [Rhizomicrobium sp.]
MQAATAPVKFAGRLYVLECAIVMGLYVAAVWARPWLVAHAATPELGTAAKVLPALPIWLMLVSVWRYCNRIDEFERHKFLVTLAISFGIGSCAIVTYAFLMDAGLPPLAITWAWPTLAVSWALTTAIMQIADHAKR